MMGHGQQAGGTSRSFDASVIFLSLTRFYVAGRGAEQRTPMRRKHLLMLALVLAAAWMMAVALGGVP
jgi:hypothetical protein